ncbi:uncharacterized protein LOC126285254 [Schistocerca gregaria]|uniref:uncharacterized protein LOC126285254 n=1 Tax=Schistocerca gregaria TaxID=7010 RepID=UPI00211E639A|nr:uncharacterized protein LOC126285254 [Schistocerca gregaria]
MVGACLLPPAPSPLPPPRDQRWSPLGRQIRTTFDASIRSRTSIKEQTPPEEDTLGAPPHFCIHPDAVHPQLANMNAVFAVVLLGAVAAASAGTVPAVPAGTSAIQQQPQYQAVVQSQPQQVVGGRVVPAVYPGVVTPHVYSSGIVPSVYTPGVYSGVYPSAVVPSVGGVYPYYATV